MSTSPDKPNTRRQDLGEVVNEVFSREWLLEFAATIKNMTTGVYGDGRCPECDSARRVLVQIPDIKGQLAAVVALLEQAEGRPGTADGTAGGVTLVVERAWPVAGDTDSDELPDVAEAAEVSPV